MKLIFLGAPGAGKGTQSEIICKKLNIPVISTGNVLREAVKSKTDLGVKAKSFMDNGQLVPDKLVIDMIKDRFSQDDCKNGFILDGFPRTVAQAEALNNLGIFIDKVINIDVQDKVIIERMSGRRVCDKCGASYHIKFNKPLKEDICDKCDGNLIIRGDDNHETVVKRLDAYHNETKPLIDYYDKKLKLTTVDGTKNIDEITKEVINVFEV
ncbi:MAG: adenylate kinase [Oscillospiraceae bacterium]